MYITKSKKKDEYAEVDIAVRFCLIAYFFVTLPSQATAPGKMGVARHLLNLVRTR